ncbi:MAG: TlpA disulfide reductase family protein [Bacteroidota bacterium]
MLRLTALVALLLASGAARGQDADRLLREAFDPLLDSTAYTYAFELTMAVGDTSETVRGTALTHGIPPDGIPAFALHFPEDRYRLSFDGEIFEYASERTRKVYTDSTLTEGLDDGYLPILALHPTIGLNLFYWARDYTQPPTIRADDDAGCTLVTYASEPAPEAEESLPSLSVCYDDATGLPLHIEMQFANTEELYDLRVSDVEQVPVPPLDAFRIEVPDGWSRTNYSGGDGDALAVGERAPEFTLQTASGETVALSNYRGQTVVLDFWGTWCVPCVKALPAMADLASEHADVPILGLASYEDAETDPEAFARARGVEYPILRTDEATLEAYRIYAFPTYIVVGPDGSILFHEVHDAEADTPTEAALSTFLHSLNAP